MFACREEFRRYDLLESRKIKGSSDRQTLRFNDFSGWTILRPQKTRSERTNMPSSRHLVMDNTTEAEADSIAVLAVREDETLIYHLAFTTS